MIRGKRKNCLFPHTTQGVVGDFIDGRIQRVAKVIKRCPASSGNVGSQKSREQDKQGKGPTPEGKYKIDLRPDGNRTAPVNPETGDLRAAKGGGVDKIPDEGKTSNGGSYTYPGWGKNRALLEPEKGTDTNGAQLSGENGGVVF